MRKTLAALLLVLGSALPAAAQLSVSININVPAYPTLQRIPDYPVYYAPSVRGNYFFYDGLYWVFDDGDWFASAWYNGPWDRVDRYEVPVYLLRVPVRYYRSAPTHFRSWRADAPPRWHEYWGGSWAQRRDGWDRWDRRSAPAPAPLPVYQRQYTRDRYPTVNEQYVILERNYRYQPREAAAREVWRERREKAGRGGPPDHAVAKGLRNRDEGQRGPPDHAVAKGLRNRDEGERGPPSHATARGHDRDDRGGRPEPARGRDRDDHPGKGKGRDKDDHPGKGKGRDKD